jgi:hypothetical protein
VAGGILLYADNSPRPAYAALKVARAMLGEVTFLGRLGQEDTGGARNVSGYKFLHPDGREIWTVWSQDGQPQAISLDRAPQAVFGVLGNEVVLSDPAEFVVSVEPLYVEWPGD